MTFVDKLGNRGRKLRDLYVSSENDDNERGRGRIFFFIICLSRFFFSF